MRKKEINKVPKALGPYSQVFACNGLVFCSGQIGIDPITNELVKGGIQNETKKVLENIMNILATASVDISQVIKTEVYLKNIDDFKSMNEIYAGVFTSLPQPARVTIEVSRLPKDALIEISCIASKK